MSPKYVVRELRNRCRVQALCDPPHHACVDDLKAWTLTADTADVKIASCACCLFSGNNAVNSLLNRKDKVAQLNAAIILTLMSYFD